MAIRPIIIAPDPRLKKVAAPIEAVDDEIRQLMDDMLETMYAAPGVGLAAQQVGVFARVIVVDVARSDEAPQPFCLANPELLWLSDEDTTYEEGCLSLPDHFADVVRPVAMRVRYLDRDNEVRELEASGMLATVIQHEIDHLEGILFVDHISALKRNMILRKLVKSKKADKSDVWLPAKRRGKPSRSPEGEPARAL
jgi:peptide deformylase